MLTKLNRSNKDLKMDSEKDGNCNLETLLVLLCLKAERHLQTCKKFRTYRRNGTISGY